MTFKDHFSGHAGDYAVFRPHYPAELSAWLASLTVGHDLAWDAGCGNGQAAAALADHFLAVFATDPSAEQISHAQRHEHVNYSVEPAEKCSFPDRSADLVVVAQALHWFDIPAFYREVDRVLRPGGVLAVWTYWWQNITPKIDEIVNERYREAVASYWPPERQLVEDQYRTLIFPYPEITIPPFTMQQDWTLSQLVGYLHSWSATKRYEKEQGQDPVELILQDLRKAWGDPRLPRRVVWPLYLRVGRKANV